MCLGLLGNAQAGRPMATDDTATASRGQCQIEVWGQRVDDERSQIAAPACGLTDTLELDTAASRSQGGTAKVTGLGLGLKWAPEGAVHDTPWGSLSLGVEAGAAWARGPAEGWRGDSVALVGLASLAMGPSWTVSANLGVARSLVDHSQAGALRAAVAWQASERWLLFAEGLASTDRGRTLVNAGLRWWTVPGRLGLDVVAARDGAGSLSVSVGLGWYGLRLP